MKSRILMAGLAALAGWCAGCRSGKPERPVMDEPMRLARDAAQADYRAGRYDGAAESWTRAIDRAYVLGDAAAAARFRYQQAASRLAAGRLEEGESLLRLAGLEALAAGESVLAARAGTAEARLALKRGRPAEARELALKAQATAGAKADSLLKADIELILAEAGLATPEGLPEARRHWETAVKELGGREGEPVYQAVEARVKGRLIAAAGGPPADAAAAFEAESEHWREAGMHAERAEAALAAAAQRARAEEWLAAGGRQWQAARILRGLGQARSRAAAGQAAEWLERGLAGLDQAAPDRAIWKAMRDLARAMADETAAAPAPPGGS